MAGMENKTFTEAAKDTSEAAKEKMKDMTGHRPVKEVAKEVGHEMYDVAQKTAAGLKEEVKDLKVTETAKNAWQTIKEAAQRVMGGK